MQGSTLLSARLKFGDTVLCICVLVDWWTHHFKDHIQALDH